ncbi:MAG TPA: hypothetical protein VLQ93_04985 [Myxococcaceae bacterium]|nr:hypothetical protein [Myxococcaceae bacterium]
MTMKILSRRRKLRWSAAWVVAAVVCGGPAVAGGKKEAATPEVPFDARLVKQTGLLRKPAPKPDDEVFLLPAGTVVRVTKLEPPHTWKEEKAPVALAKPDTQSTYYALRTWLQPLKPGEVVSDEVAAKLLFSEVPAARREWCMRFTRRVVLPAGAVPGGKGTLVYSAAVDDVCAGYLALVTGTGRSARVKARARRGPLATVAVLEVPEAPPVLDVEESIRSGQESGMLRTLLGLGKPALSELLAVELERDTLGKESRHSVRSELKLEPSGKGLDVEVRRTEKQVVLSTGAEKALGEKVSRYRYEGGKLIEVKPDTKNPSNPSSPL